MRKGILFAFVFLLYYVPGANSQDLTSAYFNCPELYPDSMDMVFQLFDQRKYDQVLNMAGDANPKYNDLHAQERLAWLYIKARSLQETLDSEAALEVFEDYRDLASALKETGCNYLFDYYINTARCHIYKGSIKEGIARLDSAYMISDKKDNYEVYQLYRTEAYLFQQQGQYRAAIEQMKLAYKIAVEQEHSLWEMESLYGMSLNAAELRSYSEAIEYLKQGEAIADKKQNLFQKWRFMACSGICHIQLEHYQLGVDDLQRAEDLGVSIDRVLCCGNDAFLAKGLYMIGQKEEAVKLAEKSWVIVSESDNTRDRRNVLHALFDIYQAEGDLEKALDVQSKLYSHREALHDRKYDQLVANMEVKYRARESALQLAERSHQLILEKSQHNQKRVILIATLFLIVFLFCLVAILWKINLKKTQVASDLNKRNELLNQIDKTKNQFFQDVSHEFRTPLSLIIGHLNELEERIKSPVNLDHLKSAIYNAQRLTDMVNQILELSKIQSVKISIHKQRVALHDWLDARIASFHSIARYRQALFKKTVTIDDDLYALIDSDKMEKVLNNLLHNACKYVSPGGRVVVKAYIDRDTISNNASAQNMKPQLVISVSNTIEKELPRDKDRIFNRHYRSGEDESFQPQGFGIGLALTKDFLQIMGGNIQLMNTSENVFKLRVYLPLELSNEVVKGNQQDQLEYAQGKVNTDTILVVEDQAEIRELLKSMLLSSYRIITAENAPRALELLRNQKIDLMITDMWMPDQSGLALLSEVRTQPSVFKNIPIIMLSGDLTDATRLAIFKAGADIFLPKPIQKCDLLTHIENLLQKSKSRNKDKLLDSYKDGQSAEQVQFDKAEKWIFEHLSDPELTVGEVAAYMNISERSLERLFKKTKGITPIAFIRSKRMHVAYHLLMEGRCSSVTEARSAVGIENPSYFSRNFAKHYGFSPGSLLRKEHV